MRILALSSGTSVDGIDVALADLVLEDSVVRLAPLLHRGVAYSDDLRAALLGMLPPAATTVAQVCRADTMVGQEFAAAARALLEEAADAGLTDAPELVVSHGQTVFHWVEDGAVHGTLQVGQPAWIAEATGLPVLSDVRVNDVAAGGQGAPLASMLDVLLIGGRTSRGAALNLGGIANVTVAGGGLEPVAFDTGPANALLDAVVARATDGRLGADVDGALAAAGRVDADLLAALRDHPYFALPAPKSTGKELLHLGFVDEALASAGAVDPALEDLAATLTELTATTVADALAPYAVGEVVASGGGVRNPAMMRRLADRLAPATLVDTRTLGLDPDAKEAYLFALLGFLGWHGLPGVVPSCTGARRATVAGRLTPGRRPLQLPTPLTQTPTSLTVDRASSVG